MTAEASERGKNPHGGGSQSRPSVLERLRRRLHRTRRRAGDWLWSRTPAGVRNRERLGRLEGQFRGRRAFIFGGGPSLHRTDITRLGGEVTIASNGIFLLFEKMGYLPTFLTVEDRLVAEDRRSELGAIRGTTKIFPRDLADVLPPDPDTLYLNFLREYPGFPRFSEDLVQVAYWGGTVTALNLQLALFLGCNPIVLIGFDHEYKVPETRGNVVITSSEQDANHFHPGYFGPGYRWHDPRLDRMEAAYREARRVCELRGARILNATHGGKLEIFPRVSFDELLSSGGANAR